MKLFTIITILALGLVATTSADTVDLISDCDSSVTGPYRCGMYSTCCYDETTGRSTCQSHC
ncbi:uncharacterized protein UHO2_06670 [Ustilago hordei]|uniref:uncharacterized protein n=1 Tax=Ustilago hordei TaxID=120017 RepID=UPI001A5AF490|nr:uncharacterized protein UHO2_06670 [Ustilago hordei]SYW85018.1 uncharacterized protein UHO2_06670 [Ustilago hordei]